MPSTLDPTYDTELDAGREPIAAPDAAPAILPPGRRGDRFSQEQASDAEIGAAVGQLNAGQPVTALPRQEWSPQQGQAFAAKLDEFDRQAKVARAAAQQAAIDAQMLNQMSMVAKSTKDIEIARRNIDVMGLQRDIQNGVPIHEAVSRHPMGLGSGFAGALRATAPVAPPTFGKTPSGAEYIQDPRGVPHFTPGTGQGPAHALGSVVPVNDPVSGAPLGHVIATGPNTGRFEKAATGDLNASQQVAVQRARITAINAQLANAYTITDTKVRDKFIADKSAELNDVSKTLTDMPKPKIVPPAGMGGTNATSRIRVRRKSDSKMFTYPGTAADVPTDRYEVLP